MGLQTLFAALCFASLQFWSLQTLQTQWRQVNSWFSAAVENLLLLGVLRQCFVRQRINLLVQDPSTAANIHLTHARHTLNASGATFRRSRNEIPCMPLKGSLARFAVLVSELTNLNSWQQFECILTVHFESSDCLCHYDAGVNLVFTSSISTRERNATGAASLRLVRVKCLE